MEERNISTLKIESELSYVLQKSR